MLRLQNHFGMKRPVVNNQKNNKQSFGARVYEEGSQPQPITEERIVNLENKASRHEGDLCEVFTRLNNIERNMSFYHPENNFEESFNL